MFGQRASSQIVCRLAPWISFLTSKYLELALGARTFIHSGRRGRSATGSEVSIAFSLRPSARRASAPGNRVAPRPRGCGRTQPTRAPLRVAPRRFGNASRRPRSGALPDRVPPRPRRTAWPPPRELDSSGGQLPVDRLPPEPGTILGGKGLELQFEDLADRVAGERSHVVDGHRTAELARDRRERGVLETAGGDPVRERSGVEVDVERIPVGRNPARDVNADRRDLPW